jgi:hypothetical protein
VVFSRRQQQPNRNQTMKATLSAKLAAAQTAVKTLHAEYHNAYLAEGAVIRGGGTNFIARCDAAQAVTEAACVAWQSAKKALIKAERAVIASRRETELSPAL